MSSRYKKLALIFGAAAIVMLALTAKYWRNKPELSITREASVSQLNRRENRLYFGNETAPFSGVMVEHYPSGNLKSKSALFLGILHGVSDGWHTNGVLQIREHFHEGISHGVRTKWFASGARESEATIQNGAIVGTFRRWHENGVLAESINLTNGGPEGISFAFYPSGYARAMARHENGALVLRESWKDGEHRVSLSEQSH